MKISELDELNNTKKQQTRNNEQLKRAQQQAQYDQQKNELELKRLEREKNFQIEKLKTDLEQEQEKLKNDNALRQMKQDFDLDYQKKLLEVDRLHDNKTLQKYQIDSMERIYNKLGIKEVKINQFVGGDQTSLASVLPSLGYTMNQLKSAENQ